MIFRSIAEACKPASLSDKDIQVDNVNEMSGRISFEVRILNPEKETIIRSTHAISKLIAEVFMRTQAECAAI